MHLNRLAPLLLAMSLAACGSHSEAVAEAQVVSSKGLIANAMDKAKQEMIKGNLSLSRGSDGKLAEITPQGDLLIAGDAIAITDAQRKLLLTYREQVLMVAALGMDLGAQGAELGTRAALDAVKSVFGSDGEDVKQRIKAEAEAMRVSAAAMCDLLPQLLKTQEALTASLPAIAPYARMHQQDIVQCRRDLDTQLEADADSEGPTVAL